MVIIIIILSILSGPCRSKKFTNTVGQVTLKPGAQGQLALMNMQITNFLFTGTVRKYVHSSVII